MSNTHAPPAQKRSGDLTVSHPHDPAEQQADRAADVVARGGSVRGWSFVSVSSGSASVLRDEAAPKQPTDADKHEEAGKKVAEAALETSAGKELVKKVEDLEPVKAIKKGLETTAGKVVAGGVIAAGVGGLAAAKQPLPIPIPDIKIAPGISLGLNVEGPLNSPTSGGITLTFKEQAAAGKKGPTDSEKIADDRRRVRAMNEMFKPAQQKAQERADEQAAIAAVFARSARLKPVIPLAPGAKPFVVETSGDDQPASGEQKKEEGPPVQREVATSSTREAALDTSGLQDLASGGGRPLEPEIRSTMEARFGYDFSGVRIHDDARGHAAAEGVDANAFALGEHIGLAAGQPAYTSEEGGHLLAHELAHVVQQSTGATGHVHREEAVGSPAGKRARRRKRRLEDESLPAANRAALAAFEKAKLERLDARIDYGAKTSADPVGALYRQTQISAMSLSEEELLAAIIDRDEALTRATNPVAAIERGALQDRQRLLEVLGPTSFSYQLGASAEKLTDDQLASEIDRIIVEHARGPSTTTQEEYLALNAERDVRRRRLVDPAAKIDEPDTPDLTDRAVEWKDKSRKLLDFAEKWSGHGAMLRGRYGEVLGRFNGELKKWNSVVRKIDKLEDAELAYDLCQSFSKLAETDPLHPEALATAAGEAFDAVGRLMVKTHIPLVRDYGDLLRSTRHFFANMRRIMDPASDFLAQHPEYRPYMTSLDGRD